MVMNRIRTLGETALLTLLLGFIGCAVKSQVESPQPDNRSSLATAYSNSEPTTLAFAEGGVYKGEEGRTDTPVVDVWLTFDQHSSDVGKRFSLSEESIARLSDLAKVVIAGCDAGPDQPQLMNGQARLKSAASAIKTITSESISSPDGSRLISREEALRLVELTVSGAAKLCSK